MGYYKFEMILRMLNSFQQTSTLMELDPTKSWREVRAPHSISYRIKLLSQLVYRKFQERLAQERLERYGITPFHWLVLCCLWREDGLATSGICDKLQQVGGTLTGVLDRMEERQLIRRERDANDRRIWRIWLTEEGKQLEELLHPIAIEIRDRAMKDISESECEQFSQTLDQIITNLS
jgi:DNA-binding MarR family transcriptional regulator